MIGSAISGAVSGAMQIGGAIAGGRAASKAAKNAEKMIKQQQKDNRDWFDRRYNEDATQRADAQRMLTTMMDQIRSRNRSAATTAAVMGGTNEAIAAEKAANAKAMGDTVSRITAEAADRKDVIEQQYMANKESTTNQLIDNEWKRAGAIAEAGKAMGKAGDAMGKGIGAMFTKE